MGVEVRNAGYHEEVVPEFRQKTVDLRESRRRVAVEAGIPPPMPRNQMVIRGGSARSQAESPLLRPSGLIGSFQMKHTSTAWSGELASACCAG